MAQERSIEVKVGVLILVSLVILGGFILVMGGLSFEKTYAIYVDFDNPGALQSGSAVRMAGVKIGSVSELKFLGTIDPKSGRRTLVRAKASIEAKYKDAIHFDPADPLRVGNADFYVTAQGVLGEQFLAIDPGDPTFPVLQEGANVKGIDPPRLDLFLAKAYELLDTTVNGIRNNRKELGEIIDNTSGLLRGLNTLITENKDKFGRIIGNAEQVSQEAVGLTHSARTNFVDNPKVLRIIDNADRLTSDIRRDAQPLLKDAKEAVANLNRISGTLSDPKDLEKIRKTIDDVQQLASRANATTADAQSIVAHIKQGKGTVGALVMDEEVYDNLQEMVRDLKHNPWKFLWRE